jgi:hypothetical protein
MFVDLLGKARVKLCIRAHTTRSDGYLSPEERAERFIDKGFDAVAITDTWNYMEDGEIGGLKVISGCEYKVGENYTLVAVGMTSDPKISSELEHMVRTSTPKTADLIKKIHLFNGFAFLARVEQNENEPSELVNLSELDGMEIYGADFTRSTLDESYAGERVDGLARLGKIPVILASGGVVCDDEESDGTAIMVESVDMQTSSIVRALKNGRFYATQGPEIHLIKVAPDKVKLVCSPASRVEFFSDLGENGGRELLGEAIIEAEYTAAEGERFVRAEITDADGKMAWSNIVTFEELYR